MREVINYVQAMNYGLERLTTLPALVRLIRESHERLLRGVRGHDLILVSYAEVRTGLGPAVAR